jgi:hypothetical protein
MWMFSRRLACLAALFGLMAGIASAEDSALAPYFGFKPVEVFKLADRSGNMLTGGFEPRRAHGSYSGRQ